VNRLQLGQAKNTTKAWLGMAFSTHLASHLSFASPYLVSGRRIVEIVHIHRICECSARHLSSTLVEVSTRH